MKKQEIKLEKAAKTALQNCLAEIPFLKIVETRKEYLSENLQTDLLFEIKLPEKVIKIIAEIRSSGQPRLAREAVNQLLRYKDILRDSYGVFVAPYISQKAAEICSTEGIGYLDLSGNCRLIFDRVYIEKGGKPNQFKEKRYLRSLYSPKAERVLRVLLTNPGRSWRIQKLAEESIVSLGQASNVKRLLYDRELISGKRGGFKLRQPASLLSEWAGIYDYRKNSIQEFYSMKQIIDIEKDLAEYCKENNMKYALTGFSGAARIAPAVRYKKAMIYVADMPGQAMLNLSLKKVDSGGNLMLFTPYDDGIFYGANEFDEVTIVSEVQLYLDLQSYRGRGEEAAEILFERIVGKAW